MTKLDKFIDISGWVLLPVFLVVLIAAFIKTQDPVLLILGLFFVGAGVSVKQANQEFGVAIQNYKRAGDNVIQAFDAVIETEKKRTTIKK